MIRRVLFCIAALTLAACASQPPKPSPAQTATAATPPPAAPPPETSVETANIPAVPDPDYKTFTEARAAFVADTAAKYGIDPAYVDGVLAQAQYRGDVVALMAKPAERVKPWSEYRARMLTDARIAQGRAFYAAHRDALARVEAKYGVPAQVIVAILGVETNYGDVIGKHRVLDALYTLAFFYPRSGDPARLAYEQKRELFFRSELGQLFALCRDEKLDIASIIGSYAGAMGMAQFMPSSYREYAVDGDGDGRRDLYADYDDAFASVANYFVRKGGDHGWLPGAPVAARATLLPGHEEFNPTDWRPTYTLPDLAARGYLPLADVPAGTTATPFSLDGEAGREYWLGFRNYYAITRYNNSKMYAMAVYELSQAVAEPPASPLPSPSPVAAPAAPAAVAAPAAPASPAIPGSPDR